MSYFCDVKIHETQMTNNNYNNNYKSVPEDPRQK
jgi:hypothetical protein